MTAIKALVGGLGLVILVMIGLVIWGLMRQGESLRQETAFEELALSVPAGCTLAAAEAGGGELLILRLEGPLERGCQQAILVDRAGGGVVGRIKLQAE
ncbi:MAG: hypothetical protein WD341_14135 [Tistlia sp.]|uniref:hypothetical protein n=1 Tax=Tistlia sp. TaxID=3057121 RepID=UPI0034A39948